VKAAAVVNDFSFSDSAAVTEGECELHHQTC